MTHRSGLRSRLLIVYAHGMPATRSQGTAGPGRIPCLDGLRAVSIALVIWAHMSGTRAFPNAFKLGPWMGDLANLGVRCFFVISGFLITSLLLAELNRRGAVSLKSFYLRRVFRIFPAFYAYLLVAILASSMGVWQLLDGDLFYAAVYLMNFRQERAWVVGHLWSLSVEEQFYVMWPFVVWAFGRKGALVASLLALLISPFLRLGWFYALPSHELLIGEAFPTIFDAIAAGCFLAAARERLWSVRAYRKFVCSPLALLLPVSFILVNAWLTEITKLFWLVGETYINVTVAMFIDHAIRTPNSRLCRVLEQRFLVFVGLLSYSLYLWQQPFLNRHSDAIWCTFPVNLLCVAGMALASYYLVEKPMLRLRKHLEPPKARPQEALTRGADQTCEPQLAPPQ